MYNVYDINYALQESELIRNRADVINDVLGYGYHSYSPASVSYPRGRGYGEFSLCGVPMFRWRRYDLAAIRRVLDCVQSIDNAVMIMSRSGHLFWF